MYQDDFDPSELEENRICHGCIGEDFLKAKVKKEGKKAKCSYCGKSAKGISIGELADHVDTAFDAHHYRTSDQPNDFESMMMRDPEGSFEFERHGQKAEYAIAEGAKIEDKPADHVRQVLGERHADFDMDASGDETAFAEDSHYEEATVDTSPMHANWRFFDKSLKTEARLFNREAEAVLDGLFGDLHAQKTKKGAAVIVDAGPGKDIAALYRARTFQSNEGDLKAALARPDIGIGPPPPRAARAGRMNAQGIAVFYGATDPSVALSEVRPPVGSRVVVARFEIIRPVRLLDVDALRDILVTGSIFDTTFIDRLRRAKFLEHLSERITMPVLPDDELTEYLPTQAIADYLANRSEPKIDGLVYKSVQSGSTGVNVVLFHKSSLVEKLTFPEGTKLEAWLESNTEDGPEPEYRVSEMTPKPKPKPKPGDDDWDGPNFDLNLYSPESEIDTRTPTLRLDMKDVRVHHIHGVKFETSVFSVERWRHEDHDEF